MASLSDDTLHKILQQIQNQAMTSQRALSVANAQIQAKSRERRILELTTNQLAQIPASSSPGGEAEARMYRGVGKAFVLQSREEISRDHAAQDKELADDLASLSKKAKYLEKQVTDANNQLKDIFHSQQRAQS